MAAGTTTDKTIDELIKAALDELGEASERLKAQHTTVMELRRRVHLLRALKREPRNDKTSQAIARAAEAHSRLSPEGAKRQRVRRCLTPYQEQELVAMYSTGAYLQRELAVMYGVSQQTVSGVLLGA